MKQSLSTSLQLRTELRLSPQMVMQMNLLQLPLLDFNQEIERMAEENPVIEVTNPSEVASSDTDISPTKETGSEEWDERVLQRIAELGEEPGDGRGGWAGGGGDNRLEDWTDPLLRLSPTTTLQQDLLEQVHLGLSGVDETIGEFIVQDLDTRGFITRPIADLTRDISDFAGEPVSEADVTRVLEHIRATLEPAGVCAASTEESIALQLKRRGLEQWTELLVQGFALLSAGKERELARLCAKHKVEPRFVFDQLKHLYFVPTTGLNEDSFDASTIRPEVAIVPEHPEIHGPGKYEVRYNSNAIVQLRLNPKIIDMARRRDLLRPDERQFLKHKVQQAQWLRQVIDERRNLLLRAMQEIVDRQWRFLDRGMRYLQPLTQREIAEVVARDESTISRLINGRFAETPQGTIPISAFFSQALGDASGAAAREVLRDIMDREREGTGYTDDELAEQLRLRGYTIQRRTVNKYRRMLGGYYALKRSVRRAMHRLEEPAGESA
jgi:RNA polymerase sigma-54 factor